MPQSRYTRSSSCVQLLPEHRKLRSLQRQQARDDASVTYSPMKSRFESSEVPLVNRNDYTRHADYWQWYDRYGHHRLYMHSLYPARTYKNEHWSNMPEKYGYWSRFPINWHSYNLQDNSRRLNQYSRAQYLNENGRVTFQPSREFWFPRRNF